MLILSTKQHSVLDGSDVLSPEVPEGKVNTSLNASAKIIDDVSRGRGSSLSKATPIDFFKQIMMKSKYEAKEIVHVDAVLKLEFDSDLLKKDLGLNQRNEKGYTALHCAVASGRTESAALLIENYPILWEEDKEGNTPLHLAAKYGHQKILSLLIDRGANLEARNVEGQTPLHLAILFGGLDVFDTLIRSGACVNATDCDGNSPLHFAAFKGYYDMVIALKIGSAIVDKKNIHGKLPIDMAKEQNHHMIISSLSTTMLETFAEDIMSPEYLPSSLSMNSLSIKEESSSLNLSLVSNSDGTDHEGIVSYNTLTRMSYPISPDDTELLLRKDDPLLDGVFMSIDFYPSLATVASTSMDEEKIFDREVEIGFDRSSF